MARVWFYSCAISFLNGFILLSPIRAAEDTSQLDRPIPATSHYILHEGEAVDQETGLIWQRCHVGQGWSVDRSGCEGDIRKMTHADAMKMAKGGWRVPTKDELMTLFSSENYGPKVNREVFPDWSRTWSSTPGTCGYFSIEDNNPLYSGCRRGATEAVLLVRGGRHKDVRIPTPDELPSAPLVWCDPTPCQPPPPRSLNEPMVRRPGLLLPNKGGTSDGP